MFVRSLVLVGTVDVCSVALLDVVVLFVGSACRLDVELKLVVVLLVVDRKMLLFYL